MDWRSCCTCNVVRSGTPSTCLQRKPSPESSSSERVPFTCRLNWDQNRQFTRSGRAWSMMPAERSRLPQTSGAQSRTDDAPWSCRTARLTWRNLRKSSRTSEVRKTWPHSASRVVTASNADARSAPKSTKGLRTAGKKIQSVPRRPERPLTAVPSISAAPEPSHPFSGGNETRRTNLLRFL